MVHGLFTELPTNGAIQPLQREGLLYSLMSNQFQYHNKIKWIQLDK